MGADIDTTVFDAAPCGLLAVDRATGAIVRANRRAASLLGVDEDALSAANLHELFAERDRDAAEAFLRADNGPSAPVVVRSASGAAAEIVVSASHAVHAGRSVVVLALLPVADAAGGAPLSLHESRRSALSALEAASRVLERPWLMFVDVDRFRSVVAQVGHVEAEAVLDATSARLREALSPRDALVRFGADEFVALLDAPGGAREAEETAERVLRVTSEPCTIGQHRVRATVSIGLAALEGAPEHIEIALARAEAAAQAAKAAGRARYRVFDPMLAEQAEQAADISEGLRQALERGELVVHYQPVIDVHRRTVAGAEALLRWERPGHGLVMPTTFIPVAERTGLISDVGAWVIHEACRQMRQWAHEGLDDVWVSVNVSARQLRSGEVVEHVRDAIADTGVRPDRCVLEVTETAIVEDPDTAAEVLRILRGMGARVALDDFGTGYSSLSRMRDMPFSELKIDRSFLKQIDTHAQDAALVAAMVALAHSFDSLAIAEGVETAEQLGYLKALKCDMAQGFVFSRAVPPNAFKEFAAADPSWLSL
ncbi:EAL domain-containing protein [Coriobacteriia bacterium Es71-Z0120]|uniref:sensor domain-containing protein n=1 Tax=Parvivirga hydrogeniphila TaxID=2939460 RepID=UPI0022608E6F|nr:GGDEF domain-containing phosphodiesterase [Parvivirga hydrogeniphila]MCL4078216.1 EAL domain-containing protein [Parvivirga hydrogeniphila]